MRSAFRGDPRWGTADLLALAGRVVAVIVFAGLFFFTGKGFEDHYGLAQRFALISAVAWVGALALALLDLYGRRRCLGRVRKTTSQTGEETP